MEAQNAVVLLLISLFLLVHHVSSERSTYIVHMDKSFMPKAFSTHHYWYSSLLKSAKSAAPASLDADSAEVKFIYTYDNAFHGFNAVMSADEVEALKKSAGFISAYADDIVTPDTTHSAKYLGLTSAAGLWPASNYGKDVIIGVIDAGICPESPSFKHLVNLVCSMNFTTNQTQTIIRSSYNCSNASSDLNYPSFVALMHAADIGRTLTQTFQRSVTNVGDGAATYKVKLEVPLNTTARVRPQTLVFRKKNETKSYSLTIRYKVDMASQQREGAVVWIGKTGKYRVRSPIMVSAAADNFE